VVRPTPQPIEKIFITSGSPVIAQSSGGRIVKDMNMRLLASVVFSLSLSAVAGCSAGNATSTTSSSGNGDGGAGNGATAASSGTSCSEILTCISNQNCNEQSCIDACIAKGSPDAQTAAKALDSCDLKNMCQDSSCLQTKCASELSACQSQMNAGGSSAGGAPQNVPAGSIPSNVVGTWTAGDSSNLGNEREFVFNADGTASYILVWMQGATNCSMTTTTRSDGTAVVDDTTITIYEATSKTTQTNCSGSSTNTPETPETLKFTYEVRMDGSVFVTDAACASQYASDPASADLYCRFTYRKQ